MDSLEIESGVIQDMLDRGMITQVDAGTIDSFVADDRLQLLFFPGSAGRSRESHDVAVALRELLRDYGEQVRAAVVDGNDEAQLQSRFRVVTLPSLVFVLGAEPLEVLPGVRDWVEYSRAFQRYLGTPQAVVNLMENAS